VIATAVAPAALPASSFCTGEVLPRRFLYTSKAANWGLGRVGGCGGGGGAGCGVGGRLNWRSRLVH
jgi:hypothetical protein